MALYDCTILRLCGHSQGEETTVHFFYALSKKLLLQFHHAAVSSDLPGQTPAFPRPSGLVREHCPGSSRRGRPWFIPPGFRHGTELSAAPTQVLDLHRHREASTARFRRVLIVKMLGHVRVA